MFAFYCIYYAKSEQSGGILAALPRLSRIFGPFFFSGSGLERVSMVAGPGNREIEPEPWPNSPDSFVDFGVCEDRRVDGKEGLTWLGWRRGGGHGGLHVGTLHRFRKNVHELRKFFMIPRELLNA